VNVKKKLLIGSLLAVVAGLAPLAPALANGKPQPPKVHKRERPKVMLKFGTMYAVDDAFLEYSIRGIPGDDLPWDVDRVHGVLLTDGSLAILVRGLIIPDEPGVPPEVAGINPADEFRAAVSCLAEENGAVVTKNIITQGFPATRTGDAFIHAKLDLPEDCVAPIVFILDGDEDDWFAVTGAETGD
jgi:hypothetical protein